MFENDVVTLTVQEMAVGAQVGALRNISAITNKRANRYGYSDDKPWETNIVAAQSELAVTRYFNLGWSGLTGFGIDVGGIIDVRSVTSDHKRLILHKDDPKDAPCVSVLYADRTKMDFKLRGWVFCREGQIEDNWKDPTGEGRWAYFVDNNKLHSMKSLRDWVNASRPPL